MTILVRGWAAAVAGRMKGITSSIKNSQILLQHQTIDLLMR